LTRRQLLKRSLKAASVGVVLCMVCPGQVVAQEMPVDPGGGISAGTHEALDAGAASLADLEIYTGELHSDARDGDFELDGAQLFAAGALEIDPAAIQEAARVAALAKAQAQAKAQCSMRAPAGTLRGGSERIGLTQLCMDSVADAATPQAAQALLFMFANLGTPYSLERRQSPGFFDCSSYAMSAYASAGVAVMQRGFAPSTHSIAPHSGFGSYSWLKTVSVKDARPGDLFLWVPPERTGHVAVKLARGFIIQTSRTGDVSHIDRENIYGPPAVIRRVIP
jgi:cell wall-associated NlpC family hydrolase